jgi:hypothetical protein
VLLCVLLGVADVDEAAKLLDPERCEAGGDAGIALPTPPRSPGRDASEAGPWIRGTGEVAVFDGDQVGVAEGIVERPVTDD